MRQIFQYSRDNLALVNVYIKNPVVTKIRWSQFDTFLMLTSNYPRRDQKIPVIWFVANSGGILGLCMGFSMVTVSYHISVKNVNKLLKYSVNAQNLPD